MKKGDVKYIAFNFFVPETGLEPAPPFRRLHPECSASANSAIRAYALTEYKDTQFIFKFAIIFFCCSKFFSP